MSITTLILLCMIILAATHVLDGTIRRTGVKKGFFLFFIALCFSASLLPSWTLNRYFSFNALFFISAASYIYIAVKRKKRPEAVRLAAFFLFVMLLYVLQLIWEVAVNSGGFYYAELAGIVLYCVLLIPRPGDSALTAYFGVCFLQLLTIIKNIIVDSYIYFDLANADVMRFSMFCAMMTFILSDFIRYLKDRREYSRQPAGPVENPGPSKPQKQRH